MPRGAVFQFTLPADFRQRIVSGWIDLFTCANLPVQTASAPTRPHVTDVVILDGGRASPHTQSLRSVASGRHLEPYHGMLAAARDFAIQ